MKNVYIQTSSERHSFGLVWTKTVFPWLYSKKCQHFWLYSNQNAHKISVLSVESSSSSGLTAPVKCNEEYTCEVYFVV